MESAEGLKVDERQQALEQWLRSVAGLQDATLYAMQGDASFRRYFRVQSYVAMDAPPPRENCAPFVAIARALRDMGLQAPEIIKADIQQGFLLLTDFGNKTYLSALTVHNADMLYECALRALSIMQSCRQVPTHQLPLFNADFMRQEWAWHQEWFLQKYLGLSIEDDNHRLDQCYELLIASAVEQPQVFMHRDYHSANLMVLPDDVGILDFQDAFIGPVTYDLASLLRDCYIDWPQQQVERWALHYYAALQNRGEMQHVSEGKFLRWFDLMGVQRHLKALMTFARKQVRDQQSQYLQHIPRTLNYVVSVSAKYKELAPLHDYYSRVKKICAP
jgi:hypothetical protein